MCACVTTTRRTSSTRHPTCESASSRCAIEPGSCMPVSTRTIPSPARSAQALQCGTPGSESGSRNRQMPGSTRSPRPISRLRLGRGTARHATVRTMAKKSRRTARERAPESEYADDHGNRLTLRGALAPATRREYEAALQGNVLSREDAWQRAVEFLFERLAVRWDIAGTEPLTRQKELLARYRFASVDERRWIRDVLRTHLAEHFPDMTPP